MSGAKSSDPMCPHHGLTTNVRACPHAPVCQEHGPVLPRMCGACTDDDAQLVCERCLDNAIRVAIAGSEYDWLACDAGDRVAMFSTAGGGYAPTAFVRDLEGHDAALRALLAMPASTAARYAPELAPEHVNEWRRFAERGMYAYDSDFNGGPYKRVAAPVEAIRLADLPAAIARVAVRVPYDFEERDVIRDVS